MLVSFFNFTGGVIIIDMLKVTFELTSNLIVVGEVLQVSIQLRSGNSNFES